MFYYLIAVTLANGGLVAIASTMRSLILDRRDAPLDLQQFSVTSQPPNEDTPHVHISGHRGGIIGWLLAILRFERTVELKVNARDVELKAASLTGRYRTTLRILPGMVVHAESRRPLLLLLLAVFNMTVVAGVGWQRSSTLTEGLINVVGCLGLSAALIACFFLSTKCVLLISSEERIAIAFKPSLLGQTRIRLDEVLVAADVLLQLRDESVMPVRDQFAVGGGASTQFAGNAPSLSTTPVPPPSPPQLPSAPVAPPVPPPQPQFPVAGSSPTPPPPAVSAQGGAPSQSFQSFGDWDGSPEPGTSDSILRSQTHSRPGSASSARPSTGTVSDFTPGHFSPAEMDDMAEAATSRNDSAEFETQNQKRTLSWEEQEEHANDEELAEAELGELRKSHPTMTEARHRLKEVMRRFPTTDAAKKAAKMLDRLESQ